MIIPEKGTSVYHVVESFVGGYHYHVVKSIVRGPYKWSSGKGFSTVTVPDYPEKIFPTPFYWKARDLGKQLFLTREEAITEAIRLTDQEESKIWCNNKLRRHWEEE